MSKFFGKRYIAESFLLSSVGLLKTKAACCTGTGTHVGCGNSEFRTCFLDFLNNFCIFSLQKIVHFSYPTKPTFFIRKRMYVRANLSVNAWHTTSGSKVLFDGKSVDTSMVSRSNDLRIGTPRT